MSVNILLKLCTFNETEATKSFIELSANYKPMKKTLIVSFLFVNGLSSAQPVVVGGVEPGIIPLTKPAIVSCAPIFSYYVPGASSNGLAWDGTAMYTRSVFSDSIHLNDPSNGNLITTIYAPSANGNQISGDLEYDGVNLWSIQEQLGTLFKMNPSTGQVINQYSLPIIITQIPPIPIIGVSLFRMGICGIRNMAPESKLHICIKLTQRTVW